MTLAEDVPPLISKNQITHPTPEVDTSKITGIASGSVRHSKMPLAFLWTLGRTGVELGIKS